MYDLLEEEQTYQTYINHNNLAYLSERVVDVRQIRKIKQVELARQYKLITVNFETTTYLFEDYIDHSVDIIGNFFKRIGHPILRDFVKGGSEVMVEKEQDWEENLKKLLEANSKSKRLVFTNDQEKLDFINNCEKVYNRTTKEHIRIHESKNFEGNVDERRWYRFAMYFLEEKGFSEDDFQVN